jgi:Pyruvate/2-oxoglutarate dehydrogenase complex, dehydrogenase (E1) component, eukaryotic type, beta subunit
MPTLPSDAKGLLLSSIFEPNPVIFLEHRWLHNIEGNVKVGDHRIPLGTAMNRRKGGDITIVASSYMTVEAIHASNYLSNFGINCEIIDLLTIKPVDWKTVYNSVEKTGRILAVDSGYFTGSIASEVICNTVLNKFDNLRAPPAKLAMPDVPEPTSQALTKGFYIRASNIVEKVLDVCGIEKKSRPKPFRDPSTHDTPGDWFKGPF